MILDQLKLMIHWALLRAEERLIENRHADDGLLFSYSPLVVYPWHSRGDIVDGCSSQNTVQFIRGMLVVFSS